jgi:hypothetical protein
MPDNEQELKTENKGGRPFKEIDPEMFESLCRLHVTKSEMEDFFGVNERTLTNWCKRTYDLGYYEAYKQFQSEGKISLRRWQWKKAEKLNVPMLIWLGKQYLDQRDKAEVDATALLEIPQIVNDAPDNKDK